MKYLTATLFILAVVVGFLYTPEVSSIPVQYVIVRDQPDVSISKVGSQKAYLALFADTMGGTLGDTEYYINLNKNYSDTTGQGVTQYYLQPPSDEVWRIARLMFSLIDAKTMDEGEYGNLGVQLPHGIRIFMRNGDTIPLNGAVTHGIQTNGEWGEHCYDVTELTFAGNATNDQVIARWTFTKAGVYLRLDGASNEALIIQVNDDLSGLVAHRFLFQGYKE